MRIVLFYHSSISDWNHGNAHFLRGIAGELIRRGHDVRIFEPNGAFRVENVIAEYGEAPIEGFYRVYSPLDSTRFDPAVIDLDQALDGAALVIVHEWNSHSLVRRIGEHRRGTGGYVLFFHDTHHRAVTDPSSIAAYDLSEYDGVLAFGESLSERYRRLGLANHVWTWHEAADTAVFRPVPDSEIEGDLVWIGNWGDEERTAELHEFLLDPVRDLRLQSAAYGVRYPQSALDAMQLAGSKYRGWIPNYLAPRVYARFHMTLHVPRRPYVSALPGIPTIRVFEALACGVPLICSPWNDCEGLFTPGEDFLLARDGCKMRRCMAALRADADLRRHMAEHGRSTILRRHTCSHRVDELLQIHAEAAGAREMAVPVLIRA